MRHVRGVLGSIWTIVGGLVLVGIGVYAFYAGSHEAFGWFVYAEENPQKPILVARFGTEALTGLSLVGVGLVVAASAAGFRFGARTQHVPPLELADGVPGE